MVAHLSGELKHLSRDFPTELGVLEVTATEMRKMTSTQVAKDSIDDATVRTVGSHMTHTTDTAKRFYQHLQGQKESVEAFRVINGDATKEELPCIAPPAKKQRQKWLAAEEEVLSAG